ncbi:hypothetical protein MMC34_002554 [Xylographa carneopallida]|nr:hypothetical protein [Xylographa carneopallida]
MYSSQTEASETEDEPAEKVGKREKEMPTLIDILGLCYMGMILLRLPASLGELHRWAFAEEIPYVLPLRYIPRDMKSRLPVRYLNALDMRLLALVVVAVKLYHPFDPLERYTKLLTETGCLTVDWDLWQKEQATLEAKIKGNKPFSAGSEINVSEHDVFDMTDLQVDAYLDWYEKTWIDPEEKERNYRSLPQDLLNMFPTGRLDGSRNSPVNDPTEGLRISQDAYTQKLTAVQNGLKMREVVSEAREGKRTHPVRRIGSMHACYRHMKDIPLHAKVFYEIAATVVTISLPTLVTAVYNLELKLQKWRKAQLSKKAEVSLADEVVDTVDDEEMQDMELDTSVTDDSGDSEGEQEA